MNILPLDKRVAILRALCEGNSIRGTARLTDTNKDTVMKLLVDVGEFASIYQHHAHAKLPNTQRVEADEIWAFVGAKARSAVRSGDGDIWTFTAVDAESKLMISWLVGPRTVESATAFMVDLRSRMTHKIQLTTDAHNMYHTAVRAAFDWDEVDWAMLLKEYGHAEGDSKDAARRYSPPVCTGTKKLRQIGHPDPSLISTAYIERTNLTLRMQQRRFTRLTNAFSKKAENHAHAVSLFFFYYNYCRVHQTLTKEQGKRTTPAMAAGLTGRVWAVKDIFELMDPARLLGAA